MKYGTRTAKSIVPTINCLIACRNTGRGTSTGSNVNIGINVDMAKQKIKTRLWLLSWDMLGLESLLDLTMMDQLREEEDQERMLAILRDPESRDPGNQTVNAVNRALSGILLRARMNSHRHYEVYTVLMDADMDDQSIRDLFDDNPQGMADLIRERGTKVYSDRLATGRAVIT